MKIKTAWINITSENGELLERIRTTEPEMKNEASRFEIIDAIKRAVSRSPSTITLEALEAEEQDL
jgi:hypothetical protein